MRRQFHCRERNPQPTVTDRTSPLPSHPALPGSAAAHDPSPPVRAPTHRATRPHATMCEKSAESATRPNKNVKCGKNGNIPRQLSLAHAWGALRPTHLELRQKRQCRLLAQRQRTGHFGHISPREGELRQEWQYPSPATPPSSPCPLSAQEGGAPSVLADVVAARPPCAVSTPAAFGSRHLSHPLTPPAIPTLRSGARAATLRTQQ
jgi:hypothetical protein